MSRLRGVAFKVSLLALVAGVSAFTLPATGGDEVRGAAPVTIAEIAHQLGVKPPADSLDEFTPGRQFTTTLEDTLKIQDFGFKNFHVGARVTVARVSPDRVYIEIDELDPPQRKSIRIGIRADGRLIPPPRV